MRGQSRYRLPGWQDSIGHHEVLSELEGYLGGSLRVRADDVVEEGMSSFLNVVARVDETCTQTIYAFFRFYNQDTKNMSLAEHVERRVCKGLRPAFVNVITDFHSS